MKIFYQHQCAINSLEKDLNFSEAPWTGCFPGCFGIEELGTLA